MSSKALLISLLVHAFLLGALVWTGLAVRSPSRPTLAPEKMELTFVSPEPEKKKVVPEKKIIAPVKKATLPLKEATLPVKKAVPPVKQIAALTGKKTSLPEKKIAALPDAAPQEAASVREAAKPLSTIRPIYPKSARRRGEEGTVLLEVEVAADGSVRAARVVESSFHAALDAAALSAVRSAHFAPAREAGHPVASHVRLPLAFRLKK